MPRTVWDTVSLVGLSCKPKRPLDKSGTGVLDTDTPVTAYLIESTPRF
jgi:hypothetical protein